MYGKLCDVLQKYFSFSSFHDGQMETLLPLLHSIDVFVHMATGSGKSICMFLGPLALSDSAVGVVISPLSGGKYCINLTSHIVKMYVKQVSVLNKSSISAIQIRQCDASKYDSVSSGQYRFGEGN